MDGKSVTKRDKGIDTVFNMYRVSYWSYWLSASSWYEAPDANKCGDSSKITKTECSQILNAAMLACDPNSGTTHGASFPGQCIQYNITLDRAQSPQSPPWNPVPDSQTPQCDKNSLSGVQNSFFQGVYPQFCSAVNDDKTKQLSKDLTNNDFKTPSKRSMFVRTPPPSSNQYDGYTFHFEWSGGSDGDCLTDCNGAYAALVQSPCKAQLNC